MAKRGNGEGTIYQRQDGRWAGVIHLGWVKGRERRRAFYGATRRQVQEQLTAALRSRQLGLPSPSERRTTGAYLGEWLESVRPTLRPRTWARYEQIVRVHAAPAIGRIPLARLRPEDLQKLYSALVAAGSAPATVLHVHAVLHRALRQAERWGAVGRNVATLVDRPRLVRHEMRTLSPEESRALLDAATADRVGALYVLALTSGMREGELLGLRWRDVDFDAGAVRVRHTLQRTRAGLTLSEPKTAHSRRQVVLTRTALAALRRHRIAQAEERLRLGAAWEDLDLVFANEIGRPFEAANLVHRSFLPLLARAGLPRVRFHDLRHSAATLLLGRGVHPKIVAEQLGHATIAITLDLYSHVTPTMQREAAATMDGLLAPGRS